MNSNKTLANQLWLKSEKLLEQKEKILNFIKKHKNVEFLDIVRYCHMSIRPALYFINKLYQQGLIEINKSKITLNRENRDTKTERYSSLCHACFGKTISLSSEIMKIKGQLQKICDNRPHLSLFLGQRVINIDSILFRVAYMDKNCDLEKSIIFIGDDDLTSLGVGLLRRTQHIVVVDVDSVLLRFIRNIADKEKLNISTIKYDLFDPLPEKLQHKFDVFVADPYPTLDGHFEKLFWTRGLQMLKKKAGMVGYTFTSPSHKSKSFFLRHQRILTDMNVVITDIIPFFNDYCMIEGELTEYEMKILKKINPKGEEISHTKSLVRFETTDKTQIPELPTYPKYTKIRKWVIEQYVHDLLLNVGIEKQKKIAMESVGQNNIWADCLDKLNSIQETALTTTRITTLLEEVTGIKMSDQDFIQEISLCGTSRIKRAASLRGYVIDDSDIATLLLIAKGGIKAIKEKSNISTNDNSIELYLLNRIMESYYRLPG